MVEGVIPAAFTALDRFALALVIGISSSGYWLLVHEQERRNVAAGFTWLLGISLVLLAITSMIILIIRAAAMADVPPLETGPFITKVLTHSDFGVLWIARILALCGLIIVWIRIRYQPTSSRFLLIAFCGILIAFLISSASHAAEDGYFTFANLVNWLHITAGCLWGGTVAVYSIIVLPRLLRDVKPQVIVANTALRLSSLAGAALLIVLITGIINAWRQLQVLSDLWSSTYGIVLSIKIAIVAVMAGIGAYNRFFIVPKVEKWASPEEGVITNTSAIQPHRFLKVLRIDTVVFALIIVCASLLSMQAPPYHKHSARYLTLPVTVFT